MNGLQKRVPYYCEENGQYHGVVKVESIESLAEETRKLRLRTRVGVRRGGNPVHTVAEPFASPPPAPGLPVGSSGLGLKEAA
jgi:hypothetical protein